MKARFHKWNAIAILQSCNNCHEFRRLICFARFYTRTTSQADLNLYARPHGANKISRKIASRRPDAHLRSKRHSMTAFVSSQRLSRVQEERLHRTYSRSK